LNPKWPPKYKNPPIWKKFDFQVEYDVANWYQSFAMMAILSVVSDFNENWYLGVFWNEELVGNDETCIHMPEFWYGGHLGTSVFAFKHNQI
jgi:hypothetical protein